MSSLYESRWAATPPAEEKVASPVEKDTPSGLSASKWAATPPPPEPAEKKASAGLASSRWADDPAPEAKPEPTVDPSPLKTGLSMSRWADTPSPVEEPKKADEGVERTEESVRESVDEPEVVGGAGIKEQPSAAAQVESAKHEGLAEETEKPMASQLEGATDEITKQSTSASLKLEPEIQLPQVQVDEAPKDAVSPAPESRMTPTSPMKSRLEAPRLKKKVSWKGKTCIIQIPNLDYNSLGVNPMSLDEVKGRMMETENEDYGTQGFDVTSKFESDDGPVHVKPIWPDESETRSASAQRGPNVKLPDLQTWKDYMNWLTEQKLAALGVSLGNDEPASAGAQDMSRQSSNQYPSMPFSPPLPTGSASSGGRPGLTRGHTHTMSVAAPTMSPVNAPFGHMHRHSTFTGSLPFQMQQQGQQSQMQGSRTMSPLSQQSGAQPFAPSNQFGIPGFNRTGSPAQPTNLRNDFGGLRGPGSPLNQQMLPQSPNDLNRVVSNDQICSSRDYFQTFQQQQQAQKTTSFSPFNANAQFPSGLPQLPEEDDEEELKEEPEPVSKPASAPAPATEIPPETPTYVPPHKRAQINENIAVPTPRGHRHNISEGLERDILEAEKRRAADRQSWIEVVESGEEPQSTDDSGRSTKSTQKRSMPEPPAERDPLSQDLVVQEAPHSRKKSTAAARLNVSAPAFKFNPGATFQPASTAFNFSAPAQPNPDAQPPSTAFSFSAPAPDSNAQPSFGHTRQQSSGNFNAAAPIFRPGGSSPMSSVPQGEFSFSSNGPVFKPGARSFEAAKQPGHKDSIFGKVEIPDIVKPARRSKAIEIKRPEEEDTNAKLSASGTEAEDSDGRITQSDERMKRQRKAGDDGDEVPRFADQVPVPAPAGTILKSHPQETDEDRDVQEQPSAKSVKPEDVVTPPDSSKSVEPDRQAPLRMHKPSSSLSALAKPFAPSDTEQAPAHQAQESYASISELEEGELKDDDHPPTSPLEHSEPSPLSDEQERGSTPSIASQMPLEQPPSARVNDFHDAEPSYDEIDAVMRQLNDMDDDHEDKRIPDISPLASPDVHPMEGVTYLGEWDRSDAPSPSPRRRQQMALNDQQDSSFTVNERADSVERNMNGWPEPHRLNKADDAPMSDWSRDFSVNDEEKLQQRGQFFNSHIESVIGRAVEKRLQPLEDSLRSIYSSVNRRPISRDVMTKRSSSVIESDADDEDEVSDEKRQRPISRGKDKRTDQIKAAVLEALREQSPSRHADSAQDMQELHQVLHDMKMSFARAASASLELQDIRAVVEEIVGKQSQALVPAAMDENNRDVGHRRDMSELEQRLNETLASALEEANLRRSVEERDAETRRLLRLAEEEVQLLRDARRDDESRHHAAEHAREDLIGRLEKAEDAKHDMEEQIKGLEAESEATHATLEEYRMSSHKWRQDIDQATREREDLENTIAGLERELEESQELGGSMRKRLEKLHSDMAAAAGQLASDKAAMKAKEEEYHARCEYLEAQHESHVNERSQLEEEVRTLRAGAAEATELQISRHLQERSLLEEELQKLRTGTMQESEAQQSRHLQERSLMEDELGALRATAIEAAETKVALDQMRVSNSSLEEMVRTLQVQLVDQQALAAKYERDYNDAREAARAEVERTRMSMETDIEQANHQVNVIRVELEGELSKLRLELENVRIEAETAKARHERHLEEEEDTRRETLRKVNHTSSVALDEARQKHESTVREMQANHDRALRHAIEDKDRSEYTLNDRLALSDSKLQHFQDRVLHLEERLEVAKSAAQAAAMSAQSTKGAPVASSVSALPEKISPQALRESILVLQEQLQEREARIDKLQSKVDNEGPAQLKKKDDEIAWLRELLTVRSEELTDLVNTLAQPTFDRAAVRDTAIRIRANLQMEQQEKDRLAQNANSIPGQAIASLAEFATPKAAQLTSAFNKWRSNMESSALKNAPRGPPRPRSNTPSKPATSSGAPSGYMSGLMTPPASNLRSTPSPEASGSLPPPRLQPRAGKEKAKPMTEPPLKPRSRVPSASSEGPTTPLFRSQSYDKDAEDNEPNMENFEEEDEDLDIADNQPPAFRSLEDEMDTAVEEDEDNSL